MTMELRRFGFAGDLQLVCSLLHELQSRRLDLLLNIRVIDEIGDLAQCQTDQDVTFGRRQPGIRLQRTRGRTRHWSNPRPPDDPASVADYAEKNPADNRN